MGEVMILRSVIFLSFLFISHLSSAQDDIYQFDTDKQRSSYQALSAELRCPKCQNQNLADSNSEISEIMRDVIAEQLVQGKSEDEVKAMMVDRYGEFVLYKPPVKTETLILWWAPVVFIGLVVLAFIVIISKRSKYADDPDEDDFDQITQAEGRSSNEQIVEREQPSKDHDR